MSESTSASREPGPTILAIFLAFLKLGLTSFGGPIAHLGYFHQEFVERRRWLDDHAYADLVALCQFLPGPASSQVGMALGFFRGGFLGSLAAWLGFTLPSAIALVLFGLLLTELGNGADLAWLHGLKVVAVAVVALAVWAMGRQLCSERIRASIAVTWLPGTAGQIGAIVAGGLIGWLWLRPSSELPHTPFPVLLRRHAGLSLLVSFAAILLVLPVLVDRNSPYALQLFDALFRIGSLVFGGGHVVLPLIQAAVVPSHWLSADQFLAGYGVAQAVPGPLFSIAAYVGAMSSPQPNGWLGAAIALIAIFLPSFLLVIGMLPLWEGVRRHSLMQRTMQGDTPPPWRQGPSDKDEEAASSRSARTSSATGDSLLHP